MADNRLLACAGSARWVLHAPARAAIAEFVLSRRVDRRGFHGRDQRPDLYYTAFALACLHALGRSEARAGRELELVCKAAPEELDCVHLCCLVRCLAVAGGGGSDMRRCLTCVERFASADGGYSHLEPAAAAGTAYGCFLVWQAYLDADSGLPAGRDPVAGSRSLSRAGYAADTTSVLAAKVALASGLGGSAPVAAVETLLRRRVPGGGFSAPGPEADLLSTACALFALRLAGADLRPLREGCLDFVHGLWHEGGGFRGHGADAFPDCEYTFYALLAVGCLA